MKNAIPLVVALTTLILYLPDKALSQTCFIYVDSENAKIPIECVQKSDLSSPCSWPSDCASIPAASPRRFLECMKSGMIALDQLAAVVLLRGEVSVGMLFTGSMNTILIFGERIMALHILNPWNGAQT